MQRRTVEWGPTGTTPEQLFADVPALYDLGLTPQLVRDDPEALDLQAIGARTETWENVLASLSRRDINLYADYVLGIRNAPFHADLHAKADANRLVMFDAPVEHGKSTQFGIVRHSFRLGQNPAEMLAHISNSTVIPYRAVQKVAEIVESNERFHRTFPTVQVERAMVDQLWLARPASLAMHPSLVGIGIAGAIIGTRYTGILTDDVLDFDNTYSKQEQDKVFNRLFSTVRGRLVHGGPWIDIGTPWYAGDPRERMRDYGFVFFRYDAEDLLWPETYTDANGIRWGWPAERLAQAREELPSWEYDRTLRCLRISQGLGIFRREHLQRACALGAGGPMPRPAPAGLAVVTGVDVASRTKRGSHETVMTTAVVGGRLDVLDIRGGRWGPPQVIEQFRVLLDLYPNHQVFMVEDNSAQMYLVDALKNREMMRGAGFTAEQLRRLHVQGFTTTKNKRDSRTGVPGLSMDFEQEKIALPADERGRPFRETKTLVDGLETFVLDSAEHTSDYVMSLWLCRGAARLFGRSGVDPTSLASRYGIS